MIVFENKIGRAQYLYLCTIGLLKHIHLHLFQCLCLQFCLPTNLVCVVHSCKEHIVLNFSFEKCLEGFGIRKGEYCVMGTGRSENPAEDHKQFCTDRPLLDRDK